MVLLGGVGHVESCFDPFGDSVRVGVRLVHGLRQMYHRLGNHFGRIRLNSIVTWVKWNLVSVCLETVLALVQDQCMVCAKCTIGSEIMSDVTDGTTR